MNSAKVISLILCFHFTNLHAATIKTKVLVLGAGAAGVGFANRLLEKGQTDFIVLEAQNVIGGRIRDTKFGNLTIQEGAGWIHSTGSDNLFSVLKTKMGLKTVPDNYNDFIVRDLKGNVVNNSHATYQKLRTKIDEFYTEVEKMQKYKEFDIPAKSALQLVGWDPITPLEKTIDYYLNDFENEAPPWVLSAQQVGFTGEGKDEVVTDQRGYAYILRQVAKNFTAKIRLSTVVKKISYDDKKVTVQVENGDIYEANYAYVTFSTGVLTHPSSKSLFNPPLPSWKMKAAYMLDCSFYTKIFVKFPTKFWDSNRYVLIANEDRGNFVHYQNLDRPDLFPGERMLVATVTGFESERVEKLTDAQVKQEIFNVMKKVYVNATAPSDIFVSRWSLDNTTYGAYSSPVVGTDAITYQHLRAPVNKTLWFGGEAATSSDVFGYAHGAYKFAIGDADKLVQCMGNSASCPVYKPRTIPTAAPPPKSGSSMFFASLLLTLFTSFISIDIQ